MCWEKSPFLCLVPSPGLLHFGIHAFLRSITYRSQGRTSLWKAQGPPIASIKGPVWLSSHCVGLIHNSVWFSECQARPWAFWPVFRKAHVWATQASPFSPAPKGRRLASP
jgi:hypothetical protein